MSAVFLRQDIKLHGMALQISDHILRPDALKPQPWLLHQDSA